MSKYDKDDFIYGYVDREFEFVDKEFEDEQYATKSDIKAINRRLDRIEKEIRNQYSISWD